MRIDSHQHFWRLDRGDYGWLTPRSARIYRDFSPSDLRPWLTRTGVDRTILVQAAPTVAETHYLLDLARSERFIAGVVGWSDFESPDVERQIRALANRPKLVGLRPMLQDIPDRRWLLRKSNLRAIDCLQDCGLTFDALVKPAHLDTLCEFVASRPGLPVVVDHCAKPGILDGDFRAWADAMSEIAEHGHVFCKLSGLVTEAGERPNLDELRPYVDHVIASFSADRVMWGSDWPVLELAMDYATWAGWASELMAEYTESERQSVFGHSALRFYGLTEQ